MRDDVNEFKYLWDGSNPNWVLYQLEENMFIPINKLTGQIAIIEDNDIARQVKEKMKRSTEIINQKEFDEIMKRLENEPIGEE